MENITTKGFCELNETEMMEIDGGSWQRRVKSAATFVSAVTLIVVDTTGIFAAPAEPTTITKFDGGAAIVGGVASIGGGLAQITNNV